MLPDRSKRGLFAEGAAPCDLIGDLPTSSRAAEVKTALAMVDREREMREELRAEVERLRATLGKVADKAKYLSEPAWTLEGCALVGKQIYEWASDALDEETR